MTQGQIKYISDFFALYVRKPGSLNATPLMFTEDEFHMAYNRAIENQEKIPECEPRPPFKFPFGWSLAFFCIGIILGTLLN